MLHVNCQKHFSAPALTGILLLLTALLASHAKETAAVITEQIACCLHTLIPSLFGCTALSVLLQTSGAGAWLGSVCRLPAKYLHWNPEIAGIFLISQIAGYPVGAMLLRQAVQRGTIDKQTAGTFACFCFGGGPAFLVGLTGAKLFGSAAAGWWMLAACITANLIIACILHPHKPMPSSACKHISVRISPELLTDAVSAAMRSLAQICGTVLLFGILRLLCELLGFLPLLIRCGTICGLSAQTIRALFAVCTDVTQIAPLFSCGFPLHILLPLSTALLAFGGFCVHCQCLALGCGIRLQKLLFWRVTAALLAAFFMLPAAHFLPLNDAAAVFSRHAVLSQSGSVFPALFIFCSGFPLLIKKD